MDVHLEPPICSVRPSRDRIAGPRRWTQLTLTERAAQAPIALIWTRNGRSVCGLLLGYLGRVDIPEAARNPVPDYLLGLRIKRAAKPASVTPVRTGTAAFAALGGSTSSNMGTGSPKLR